MSREAPEGWQATTLGDVCPHIARGDAPKYADSQTGIWALGQRSIRDEGIELSHLRAHASERRVKDQSILQPGDVCINSTGTGTLGRVGFWAERDDGAVFADTHVTILRPDMHLAWPRFIFEWLRSPPTRERIFKECVTGSTNQIELSRSALRSMALDLPPLHEQRRIAEILSSVDDAIAATRAVIEQTRKVKQGVLERLLTKGIGHTRFKQTEIGEIPEEWPLTTADDVCAQISVGIVIKPSQYYAEAGIRCFRSANVREGFVEDADWVYITEEGNRVNRKSVLRTGDVLVVRTGYPGTSCVVPPRYDGANCIDIIFARPKNELIDATFLSTFINSESGKTQVLKAEGGLAQKHFNVGAMKQMKLPLPPIGEQREIVMHVEEFAGSEAVLEKTLQQQIRAKSALTSDLLSGRKRVTAPMLMAAE